MDEIAQEADFGKATLYYYYKSKEDIFNTIAITGWISLWDGIEDIVVSKETPRRKFIKIIKKLIELVNEDRPLYEFLFAAPHTPNSSSKADPEWKQYQQKFTNTLQQIIQTGIEANEFPQLESEMILKALGHIFHGMVFLGADRDNITEDDVEERLFPDWSMKTINLDKSTDVVIQPMKVLLHNLVESHGIIAKYTQPAILRIINEGLNP
jgi:AcrR family transcriptional regulator